MAKNFLVRTGNEINDIAYETLDFLPISGGTVTGELNVATPTKAKNATTKEYVDSKVSSATYNDTEIKASISTAQSTADAAKTKADTLQTDVEALKWITQYKTLIEKLAAVGSSN